MSPGMNRWILSVVVALCSSAYAQTPRISSIGHPIHRETARAWLQSFEHKKRGAVLGHMYGKQALQELLALEGVAGLHIFKGWDDTGTERLIFKAADADGAVIHPEVVYDRTRPIPCQLDCEEPEITTVGGRVDGALAQRWMTRYQDRAPNAVRSHLFGRRVFEELLAQEGAEGIYFAYGLDGADSEHLVLVGIDGKGRVMWDGVIINSGLTCPPACTK
jgi:hypothetical protein